MLLTICLISLIAYSLADDAIDAAREVALAKAKAMAKGPCTCGCRCTPAPKDRAL